MGNFIMIFAIFHRSALFVAISSVTALTSTFTFANDEIQQLPVIQVTASNDENETAYIVEESDSATKLNIPLQETPQTVSVVTQ